MARITVEDCLKEGYNKFTLVHLAAKRVLQLRKGKEPLITTSNKEIVSVLREIAAKKVMIKEIDNLSGNDLEKVPEIPVKEESEHIDQGEDLDGKT
jgi:DNA-directed RNA polymerase subunit omega